MSCNVESFACTTFLPGHLNTQAKEDEKERKLRFFTWSEFFTYFIWLIPNYNRFKNIAFEDIDKD